MAQMWINKNMPPQKILTCIDWFRSILNDESRSTMSNRSINTDPTIQRNDRF